MQPISTRALVDQLLALGVRPGGVLVVHTAFSKVAPVDAPDVAEMKTRAT